MIIAESRISLNKQRTTIMSRDRLKISILKQKFATENNFTAADLKRFYESYAIVDSQETFRSRIYRLVKMGTLQRIGQGIYRLGQQTTFIPTITPLAKRVYGAIHENFPFASASIWHTSTLNEFMIQQPFIFHLIVEIEKDAAESVFYFMKEKFKNVYLNPGYEIYQNYIAGKKDSIIVKNLISESPIQDINNIMTPTIEKILVDIFCDKVIHVTFQGKEMRNIFENSFEKYTINLSTLSRYAHRRGKKEEMDAYIKRLNLGMTH
ncbi:MAG: DUF6577 family protein [Bacteroidia bacterium]